MGANISIFVPHNGCPNMCSFCNQFAITSHVYQPSAADVDDAVNIAVNSMGDRCKDSEIAFFGGSFTAIERSYMIEILSAAYKYICSGTVKGIRVSTRPDAINNDILDVLERYGVTTIELGAQSMNDEVLLANKRGHTCEDVIKASKLIKNRGFALGLQMMTGLYLDDDNGALSTCEQFIALKPDCVRIYPTIVLKDTLLADYFNQKIYSPQTVENAVNLCGQLLKRFNYANIPVIRIGLHTINEDDYIAGPWHPAFGELCEGQLAYLELKEQIKSCGRFNVFVHPSKVSKTIGHKRCNILKFEEDSIFISVKADDCLKKYEFRIEEVSNS